MGTSPELISIKPFEDYRGTLKKILQLSQLKGKKIEEVYLLYSNPGSVRGNHYHKLTLEYFAAVSGTASIALLDLATGKLENLLLSANDNKVLMVPPGIAHAFKNTANTPLIVLALATREYNELSTDTYKYDILD